MRRCRGCRMKGRTAGVYSACFRPDGTRIVSGGAGDYEEIMIWDAASGSNSAP